MRPEAQLKGGFYPAAPEAVTECLRWIEPPEEGEAVILDPCAGKGAAIWQIADALECRETTYAVELDERRSAFLRGTSGGAQVLGPASFLGSTISYSCFSFAWVNPPFDDEIGGGGRVEHTFLARALDLLRPRGVVALVCPETVARDHDVKRLLFARTENWSMLKFPAGVRKHLEVIVLARKRATWADGYGYADYWQGEPHPYRLPAGRRPGRFFKSEITDLELRRALNKSPLRRLLEPPAESPLPRPPIAPNHGQSMMLLAAGFLDGVVRPPGEDPHLVRGTCRKVEYLHSSEERESESGKSTTTVQTYRQRIEPIVRVLTVGGEILTISGAGEKK